MAKALLSVGQVAKRTGITVRALHHYETMGLIVPKQRSPAGYRLYGEAELLRLQHVVSGRCFRLLRDVCFGALFVCHA